MITGAGCLFGLVAFNKFLVALMPVDEAVCIGIPCGKALRSILASM